MRKKSIRRTRKTPPNPALDLFGEVPVLESELEIWMAVIVPRWYQSRGMRNYIKDYNVSGKIARWKMDGEFESIRDQAADLVSCGNCIGRFFHQG